MVRGTAQPNSYIVVSAHYDHLGMQQNQIFNGADDNGSGTAGLLALARLFSVEKPQHSLEFTQFGSEAVVKRFLPQHS